MAVTERREAERRCRFSFALNLSRVSLARAIVVASRMESGHSWAFPLMALSCAVCAQVGGYCHGPYHDCNFIASKLQVLPGLNRCTDCFYSRNNMQQRRYEFKYSLITTVFFQL